MKTLVGKMVVVGHQGVGKTSLVVRYVEKAFSTQITPTIGASFFTCKICMEDAIVKLQIWDTAGQERFKSVTPMFYRNANAALLVFDITQPISFDNMKSWVQELRGNVVEPMSLCVVGNKIDLAEQRQVSREEAMQYSNSIGAGYFESSAKEDRGLEQVFLHIASGILRLSDDASVRSLKVYECDVESTPMMAQSSQLNATDIGRIEQPSWSIGAIAHATSVSIPKCC